MATPNSNKLKENDNGFRASKLVLKGGGYITKELLMQHAITRTITNLDQFLAQPINKKKIKKLKAKNIVHASQYDILYPSNNSPTMLDEWDITLTTLILNNCCTTLSSADKLAIADIRDIRNTMYGHTAKVEMTDTEFLQKWAHISSTLTKHVTVLKGQTCSHDIHCIIATTKKETLSLYDMAIEINCVKDELLELIDLKAIIIKNLNEYAELLEFLVRAKVVGTVAGVIGGLLSAVGFVMSFVTLGLSLPLSGVGSFISFYTGLAVIGLEIGDAAVSSYKVVEFESRLREYNFKIESLKSKCAAIGCKLDQFGDIDLKFPSWVSFWTKMILGKCTQREAISIGWKVVASKIEQNRKHIDTLGRNVDCEHVLLSTSEHVASEAVKEVAKSGKTAFKMIGSTTGKVLHIGGGVVGIVTLVYDIYTLQQAFGSPKKHHHLYKTLRENANSLSKTGPTKAQVNQVIADTLAAL